MAFSLSRNANLFVTTSQEIQAANGEPGLLENNTWEIKILDGFSFTAATATQEIEISEAGAIPTRGQQVFTTAIEPAEWSVQTYIRPRYDTLDDVTDAVERILWEGLAARSTSAIGTGADDLTNGAVDRRDNPSGGMLVDFDNSNTNELLKLSFLFNLGTTAAPVWYWMPGVVVNQADIDFAIDAIASISWSGFADSVSKVEDTGDLNYLDTFLANGATVDWQDAGFPTATNGYLPAPTGQQACIRNKLSTVALSGATGQAGIGGNTYTLALTGGALSINNNITFLTPEALGVVNQPCGHFTGQRQISGNMTAYLRTDAGDTSDLMSDLLEYSTGATASADPTQFSLEIFVGGAAPSSPYSVPIVRLNMAQAHLVIPTINIEDVVSVDIPFTALPSNNDPTNTDEITVEYYSAE